MQFYELFNEAMDRCNVAGESSLYQPFKNNINLAQQDITTRHLFDVFRTSATTVTSAGTDAYPIPDDVLSIYSVRDLTNGRRLLPLSTLDFDASFGSAQASGSPAYYQIGGIAQTSSSDRGNQTVELYPVPDGEYEIKMRYYYVLPNLVNDSDVSLIPPQYHERLIDYACSVYFEKRGDSRAVAHRDKYESGLIDMVSQLGSQPTEQIHVVGSPGPSLAVRPQLPGNFPSF